MAANVEKGSISFDLANIPMGLQNAVREDHISFHLLEKDSRCRVKYDLVEHLQQSLDRSHKKTKSGLRTKQRNTRQL
jgi:non-homologous end joining protein Ku